MDALAHDIRMAARSLVRARALSATVILTLALGIGTVSAFFSLLDALRLRPLPYADPDRLARVEEDRPGPSWAFRVSPEVYRQLNDGGAPSIEAVAAYERETANLAAEGTTERVLTAPVAPEMFQLLGVRPELGRLPGPGDAYTESRTVAVIGHNLWVRTFHADPGVLGTDVRLDGDPVQVVGIMPEDFRFPEDQEVWYPLTRADDELAAQWGGHLLLARLADGASPEEAGRDVQRLAGRLVAAGLVPPGTRISVVPGLLDRDRFLGALPWICLGAAGLVLLIVCSNLASLLLARGSRRAADAALRSALGASRGRLIRTALLEGTLLAAAGGALGLLISVWILKAFLAGMVANYPPWFHPALDIRVVVFVALTTVLSVLAFGLVPAPEGSRVDPARFLAGASASVSAGRRSRRLRKAMITGQVTLAFVLVVAGALNALSVARLGEVDLGMDADDVFEVGVSFIDHVGEDDDATRRFFADVRERLQAALGPMASTAVAATWFPGLRGEPSLSTDSLLGGAVVSDDGAVLGGRTVERWAVTPEYFRTVGLAVLRGRPFTSADADGTAHTAVLSETVARRLWPGSEAVGRTLRIGGVDGAEVRIVGVVTDQRRLYWDRGGMRTRPVPLLYLAETQTEAGRNELFVRPPPDLEGSLSGIVRRVVREVDPDQAVWSVRPLNASLAGTRHSFAAVTLLLGALAAAGAGLAAMGIWGVIAQSVAERTREIGVRTALGGAPARIVAFIVRDGVGLTLLGLVCGVGVSLLATRVLRGFLYQVDPADPVVLAGAFLGFLAVGWLASAVPARQAAGVDPMEALRAE